MEKIKQTKKGKEAPYGLYNTKIVTWVRKGEKVPNMGLLHKEETEQKGTVKTS